MRSDSIAYKLSLGALALAAAGAAMAQQAPAAAQKFVAPTSERLRAAIKVDRETQAAPGVAEAAAKEAEAISTMFTRGRFDALDANHDGLLSSEEFLSVEKAKWARYAKGTSMSLADCSQSYVDALPSDIDRSLVDAKKFAATADGRCSARDKKGDGSLTWEEFAGQAWRSFKLRDSKNSGTITYEQFASRGVGSTRAAKKPPAPSPALQAQIDKKVAASNSMVKVPRSSEQVAALYAAAIQSDVKPAVAPLSADQAALRQRRLSGGSIPKPSSTGAAVSQPGQAPVATNAPARAAVAAQQPKADPDSMVERVQSWFK